MLNVPARWSHLNVILDKLNARKNSPLLSRSQAEQIYRCQSLVSYLNDGNVRNVFINSPLIEEIWPEGYIINSNKYTFVLDGSSLLQIDFDSQVVNRIIYERHHVLLVGLTQQYFLDTNTSREYYQFNLRKCVPHLHLGLNTYQDKADIFDLSIDYITGK